MFRYRGPGGRSAQIRSVKLGSWPTLTIDAARTAARAHAGQIARGADPAQVRTDQRRKAAATLGVLLAADGAYERNLQARGIVKIKMTMSSLRRGLARYMDVDIAKLSRRDLVEALDALQGRPGARQELRKCSRTLLEWSVSTGLAPFNVLAGMRMPPKTRVQRLQEAARRRALTDQDIVAVWRACAVSGAFGGLVRLALLTGMRRNELAHLRWADIQHDRIVLPAAATKTGAQHQIPLTALMRRILDRQARTTSPLVFPSNATGGVMSGWSGRMADLVREAGIGHFTIHDSRRTCRTLMSRCGVFEPIAELSIGHVKSSLVSIYNRDAQWSGRVDAFERVSDHVERLIAG